MCKNLLSHFKLTFESIWMMTEVSGLVIALRTSGGSEPVSFTPPVGIPATMAPLSHSRNPVTT